MPSNPLLHDPLRDAASQNSTRVKLDKIRFGSVERPFDDTRDGLVLTFWGISNMVRMSF